MEQVGVDRALRGDGEPGVEEGSVGEQGEGGDRETGITEALG